MKELSEFNTFACFCSVGVFGRKFTKLKSPACMFSFIVALSSGQYRNPDCQRINCHEGLHKSSWSPEEAVCWLWWTLLALALGCCCNFYSHWWFIQMQKLRAESASLNVCDGKDALEPKSESKSKDKDTFLFYIMVKILTIFSHYQYLLSIYQ